MAIGLGPPKPPVQGDAPNHPKLRRSNDRGGERRVFPRLAPDPEFPQDGLDIDAWEPAPGVDGDGQAPMTV